MYEKEKQREIHLMILLCYTIFTVILVVESIFVHWEMGAVILIILGVIASWVIHIAGKLPEHIRLWIYFIFMMLTFYFYGIHEVSTYNLAPVISVVILMYSATEEKCFVRLCAVIYYLTMCYEFVFVIGNPLKMSNQVEMRILLHFAVVFMAERLSEIVIQWRKKERTATEGAIAELKETNRRAEDFLANMSHELRTPINAVTGITTVMLKNEEDAEKKKDITSIQMAGNRLFDQIEDILDYTEVDGGSVIVTEENYAISSLVNDIIVGNRLIKKEENVELIFDVDARIPSALIGDARKVKKVIEHLINNALKFTKKGGIHVRIYALHKSYGINLCIKVSDTGIGIAEEELEKIKERFFQSSGGRNRKSSGLGLGLPIVYGMVIAMNGFIQIESEEGEGTIVSVSIPQKIADATPGIVMTNQADLCIACYLKPEKYEVPEVRDYYNTAISHMVRELDLTVHRVFSLEELKKLVSMYELTHLIIGMVEYEENASYFETLEQEMEVIVAVDDHFQPAGDSRVKIVRKPFYCLPIVNILNAQSDEIDGCEKENMICPGVRVLVVDDEPMNLLVAEGIFNAYQMDVRTVESGMAAIELYEKEEFDLVFLDHMMPEMDGVETLKQLRKQKPTTEKTPVFIAFTANAVSGAKEMFLREGFDEFISKPIEDQEMKRLLRKVLPKSSITYVEKEVGEPSQEVPSQGASSKKEEKESGKEMAADQNDVDTKDPLESQDPFQILEGKGFRTEAGLIYCLHDKEYYEELLAMFVKNGKNKMADIESSFQKEDVKSYQIMVHALKSSAKMIGADTLSEMAKEAEQAAKNEDTAYIRGHHGELLDKYQETVQSIADAFGLSETEHPEGALADRTEISMDELLEKLSELEESLHTFEAEKAEAMLAEMGGFVCHGTSLKELLGDIRKDVETFELNAASAKVKALIGRIKGGETE